MFQIGDIIQERDSNKRAVAIGDNALVVYNHHNGQCGIKAVNYNDDLELISKKPKGISVGDKVVVAGSWPLFTVAEVIGTYAILRWNDVHTKSYELKYIFVMYPIKRKETKILNNKLYIIRKKEYSVIDAVEIE